MRFIRAIVALFSLCCCISSIDGRPLRGGGNLSPVATANSQFNPNFAYGGEWPFINNLKISPAWAKGSIHAAPSELSSTGYPVYGAPGFSGSGYSLGGILLPSQFKLKSLGWTGNVVMLGSGQGASQLYDGSGTSTGVACTGVQSGGNNLVCNNQGCSAATGSISGQFLTITSASSCSLVLYQAITNGSTTTNVFGVPTMIIGMSGSANCPSCTATGGTGTYLVNFPQSVASGSLTPGLYAEVSTANENSLDPNTGFASWTLNLTATSSSNPIGNMAVVFKEDLAAYASGQVTGSLFKKRVQQANWLVMRDLNLSHTNVSNVTTWGSRKPTNYYTWLGPEMRNTTCSGTMSPCYGGIATYALNGSSNDYSVNIGSSFLRDKQTVCVYFGNTATNATITFSVDGGTTKTPVLEYRGNTQLVSYQWPANGNSDGFTYDATLNAWLSTSSGVSGNCIDNYMPPEVFVQMNQELGTTPWVVMPLYASDPITDYPIQYASYLNGFTWKVPPQFEIPDETWNCAGEGVGGYPSAKSRAYIAADSYWSTNSANHLYCGASGDLNNWSGKAGSLLAQAVRQISSTMMVIVGVQTTWPSNGGTFNDNILSSSYVNQNASNIPTQSGCAGPGAIQTNCLTPWRKTAAYSEMKGSRSDSAAITVANYHLLAAQNGPGGVTPAAPTQAEVALGFCYFFQSTGCASQSSVMTSYFNTQQNVTQSFGTYLPSLVSIWNGWYTNVASNCAGGTSCTPLVIVNYEGTYSAYGLGSDITASITGATIATNAVLSVSPNGCVQGQSVNISGASPSGWNGNFTVQSATTSTCTINLNSTGLGAISGGTLTYTGSANYISYLRLNSWLAPDLATLTTTLYNQIASTSGACSPVACSLYPSQFLIAGNALASSNCCWLDWGGKDIYGYFPLATASAATASSSNLTLGGTVTGIFQSGQVLIGNGMDGVTITGACSQTGSLPAGANSGDVCPISSSSTFSAAAITGNITPSANFAGNSTTSPVKQWGATCKWNGNTNQCDGI